MWWLLAALGLALSFLDAYLTNQIGYEANPLLLPFLGSGLYWVKLTTLPMFATLAHLASKRSKSASLGLALVCVIYGVVVALEALLLTAS